MCDQVVIAKSSSRRQYADCLLAMATNSWYGRAERTLGVGVVPFRSAVGKRIAKILDGSQRITTQLSKKGRFGIAGLTMILAVVTVMIVSGGAPSSRKPTWQAHFDAKSDPAALALWQEVQQTYLGLKSFSTTIKSTGNGRRDVYQMAYKRPDRAVVRVMSDDVMVVNRVVYIDKDGVTTTWPKNPKLYRAEKVADDSAQGMSPSRQIQMWQMWGRAMMRTNNASLLLMGIPDFSRQGGILAKGPDVVIDGAAATVVLTTSHSVIGRSVTVTTTYSIGKTDHLLLKVESSDHPSDPPLMGISTEVYENTRVNPPLKDSEVTFHAPPGAVAVRPLGAESTVPTDVQALLDKVAEAYKHVQSMSFVARTTGGASAATLTASLKKPNLSRLTIDFDKYPGYPSESLSDGVNDYGWQGYSPKKYTQVPAKFLGAGREVLSMATFEAFLETVSWMLGGQIRYFVRGDVKLGPPGMVNGVPVDTIIGSQPMLGPAMMPIRGAYVRTIYSFGKKDHLLLPGSKDFGHSDSADMRWEQTITETIKHYSVDKPLATDFQFHPGNITLVTDLSEPTHYRGTGIEIGDPFPLFKASDMQGRPFSLSQYRGKVLLLHAWTFGVGNYRSDLPQIEALYRKYRKQGFEVVGIACDYAEDRPQIEKYLSVNAIHSRQLFDGLHLDQGFKLGLKLHSFPYSYLIGRDGKVFAKNPWIPKIEPQLRAALAERS